MQEFYNLNLASTPALFSTEECSECLPVEKQLEKLQHQLATAQAELQAQQARTRELEQRLAEQREMYTTVLDQLKVEVVMFDTQHRYQYANSQCFKDEATREWVIGKTDFEYFAYRQRPMELATTRWEKFEECKPASKWPGKKPWLRPMALSRYGGISFRYLIRMVPCA
jgi:transcriptional regulator with PAS, ATPase and Fis domain